MILSWLMYNFTWHQKQELPIRGEGPYGTWKSVLSNCPVSTYGYLYKQCDGRGLLVRPSLPAQTAKQVGGRSKFFISYALLWDQL